MLRDPRFFKQPPHRGEPQEEPHKEAMPDDVRTRYMTVNALGLDMGRVTLQADWSSFTKSEDSSDEDEAVVVTVIPLLEQKRKTMPAAQDGTRHQGSGCAEEEPPMEEVD